MNASVLLKTYRRIAGMTQRDVARRAGVPQSTVARIETGRLSPRLETFERLLRACRYSLSIVPSGSGLDRTLIREMLALTPAQRLQASMRDARASTRLSTATRRG